MITKQEATTLVMHYMQENNKWYMNWEHDIVFREKDNYEIFHREMTALIMEKAPDRFEELCKELEERIEYRKDLHYPDRWLFLFKDPDRSIISPSGVSLIVNADDGSIEEFIPTI
jgi:hypothetical protein